MATSKVNFGVIGAGGIACRKTIPGMLKAKNCRLAAVMDPVGIDEIAAEFKVANGVYERGRTAGRPGGRGRLHRLARALPRQADRRWRPRPASTSSARNR